MNQFSPPTGLVTAEYQPLHRYLKNRFADTVVLTFREIEDLLGHKLPARARAERDWWLGAEATGGPTVQARSWIEARRTATPNLVAGTVAFEREA
jgi:hypothetical protein